MGHSSLPHETGNLVELQTTSAMDKLKRVLGGRENEDDDGIMSEVYACNFC